MLLDFEKPIAELENKLSAMKQLAKDSDADVTNAIRALKDYQGISGTINFNRKGDPVLETYFVFKVISPDPANWNQNTIVATYNIEPPK